MARHLLQSSVTDVENLLVHSMAIVILGGLVTSTLVNLFALPALYLSYGASREPDLGLIPVPVADLPIGAQD